MRHDTNKGDLSLGIEHRRDGQEQRKSQAGATIPTNTTVGVSDEEINESIFLMLF